MKRNNRRLHMVWTAMIALMLLIGCGKANPPPTTETPATNTPTTVPAEQKQIHTIDFGLTSKTAVSWAVFVAEHLGFFEEAGVKVNYINVGSATGVAQQLAAGSIHIGSTSMVQFIMA